MKLIIFALLIPLVAASPLQPTLDHVARNAKVNYDGHQVWSITPASLEEARDLEKRFARYHTHPIRNSLSVVIPHAEVAHFNSLGLNARLANSNLGQYIRDTDRPSTYNRDLRKRGELPDLAWFDTYHAYEDHLQYWDDLISAFPKNSRKFEIGQSWENRSIYAFQLWGNGGKSKDKEKPVILWHATVHAREWISTMVSRH